MSEYDGDQEPWDVCEDSDTRDPEAEGTRDHPLIGAYHLRDVGLLDTLQLPPPKSKKHAEARALIVAEAIQIGRRGRSRWISYSRRPEYYAQKRRYLGKPLTFATVPPAIDQLADAGYVDHQKSLPGARGTQSRFRASARLMDLADAPPPIAAPKYAPRETIVLRATGGELISYAENEQTHCMRSGIARLNEAIPSSQITYGATPVDAGGFLVLPKQKLPIRSWQYRVFNGGSFSLGGRIYGGTWQNVPKLLRKDILIDGEATVEHDHARLHPRLLCARVGQRLDHDPYVVPGFPRDLCKIALNTLINADTERAALRSLAQKIGGEGAYTRARELIEALKQRNPAIAAFFGSGAGLRLQNVDAAMAERVELKLLKQGIIGLAVHDSHIVQEKHGELLLEAMDEAWNWTLATIGGKLVLSTGYRENVPQYGIRTSALFVLSSACWEVALPADLTGYVLRPVPECCSECSVLCPSSVVLGAGVSPGRCLGVVLSDASFVPCPVH